MKRWLIVLMGLALSAGLLVSVLTLHGHAQGPGQPFPNYPFGEPTKPASSHPLLQGGSPVGNTSQGKVGTQADNEPEPNADIKVTPEAGEWMICLTVYKGPEAHQMARKLVSVLRARPYELWAYVYDYTPEAKRKEEQFRKEQIDKQIHAYKLITGKDPPPDYQIRVPKKIEIQPEVAVLVGGYKDQEIARRVREDLKKMPMPDPKKVDMDKKWVFGQDAKSAEQVYVNPLTQGFVGRNPTLPKQSGPVADWDLPLLKSLNANEPYSLLKCPKKVTLIVKEYRLPAYIQHDDSENNPLKKNKFGLASERTDVAWHNAHNLAGYLREIGHFDAYALHDRQFSLVTIGGFDSLDDPRFRETQQRIANLHQEMIQKSRQNPNLDPLIILPVGLPLKVPR